MLILIFIFSISNFSQQRRNAGKWYPDAEYLKQYEGVIMYPNEETKWVKPVYNGNCCFATNIFCELLIFNAIFRL